MSTWVGRGTGAGWERALQGEGTMQDRMAGASPWQEWEEADVMGIQRMVQNR